jgi:hypothetical protein
MNLFPSRSVLRKISQHGLSWLEVVRDLSEPCQVDKAEGYATRRVLVGDHLVGYVEPYRGDGPNSWLVVGVRCREDAA